MNAPPITSKNVFISHASKNFALADDIRRRLEARGLTCWIAPRDIPPGASYGDEIVSAIQSCVAIVVVITEEANASRAVANELELAFRNQRVIIPVRLKPVEPASSLAFFVNNTQWVDAFHTPLKDRVIEIARLIDAVRAGTRLSAPAPEKKTALASIERQIEGLIRYKFIAAVVAIAVLTLAGAVAASMSGRAVSMMQAEQAKVDSDPAIFGLVTLTTASEALPVGTLLPLRATVYLNLKEPAGSEMAWNAYSKGGDASPSRGIDVSPLNGMQAPGAQFFSFEVEKGTRVVTFCMTARHPTVGTNYTARWDFSIEALHSAVNISRSGASIYQPPSSGGCK
jgi:hypothetical protein